MHAAIALDMLTLITIITIACTALALGSLFLGREQPACLTCNPVARVDLGAVVLELVAGALFAVLAAGITACTMLALVSIFS